MDITIYDLALDSVDDFISQDSDLYARIVRKETTFNQTVDLLINVKGFTVTVNAIAITFPNDNILFVKIPSSHYSKIEVL